MRCANNGLAHHRPQGMKTAAAWLPWLPWWVCYILLSSGYQSFLAFNASLQSILIFLSTEIIIISDSFIFFFKLLPTFSLNTQFSSVQSQSCPTLWDPMNCSTPGFPVHHQLSEFTQNHVHWVSDAIQPSHPLSSPFPPALNLSQHLGLFKWVSSSHQMAKVLEFQLQHQSFQWTPRTDLL